MTEKEIDELAKSNTPMPDTLTLVEMWTYQSLKLLYARYRISAIDKDEAKDEKYKILREFGVQRLHEKCERFETNRFRKYQTVQSDAEKNGCPICKRIVRILDGRER